MTNKLIDRLEELADEMKLIVAEIRKPSTVIEEALANDIIEFEGKQYKKVDREAREGDVVIFNEDGGVITEIVVGRPYPVNKNVDGQAAYWDGETISIANFYIYAFGRTTENVDVYELMDGYNPGIPMVDETPIKTANQLRAEIIEKAKGFVESRTNGGEQLVPQKSGIAHWFIRNFDFVVNEAKRTVVVLCKSFDGKRVYERAIAKCDPSDVFNEHIGKAIALGKALGLDVSEFEQAVQPTLANGQIVYFTNEHGPNVQYSVVLINENQTLNLKITKDYEDNQLVGVDAYFLNTRDDVKPLIINDTNAQYGGVE